MQEIDGLIIAKKSCSIFCTDLMRNGNVIILIMCESSSDIVMNLLL
jgi:hypothetical protein